MAVSIVPFHHGLRLFIEQDQVPPIKIPALGVILLVGTAPIGPINSPYLIVGNPADAIKTFGKWEPWHKAAGITIPEALQGIYDQSNATVAVINVLPATGVFKNQTDLNIKFDRRGVLQLTKTQHTADTPLTLVNFGSIQRQLPSTGTKTLTLPKNLTSVVVNKIPSGVATHTYNATTGLLTVTDASVPLGATINITFEATWSATTDYIYDALAGTLTLRAGSRMLPEMEMGSITYSYPDTSTAWTINDVISNVVGQINSDGVKTGLKLAESIEALLNVSPKLIICPRLTARAATDTNLASPVINAMEAAAKILGGRVIAATEDSRNYVEFATDCTHYGSPDSRVGVLAWPNVKVLGPDGTIVDQPADARIAGCQAGVDARKGFHETFSNNKLEGVLSVTKPVTHSLITAGTESDYINERGGVVIVAEAGYFKAHGVWQPNGEVLSMLRIADAVNIGIVQANREALDKPFTKERARQIMQQCRTLFRLLEADGVLVPNPSPDKRPDIWIDPSLNSPERVAQGKIAFSFRINPIPLMTDITFTSHITRDYLTDFVKNIAVN